MYARFEQVRDPRHAHGKRYSLMTLLIVIFLAKLSGKDRPGEIADWARNHAAESSQLLKLKRSWIPHHNTIRRVFYSILDEAGFDRLAQEYSQQEQSGEGEVLAIDGKALRGMRTAGQEGSDYVLSVYNVVEQQVVAQAAVDRKENEIVAAPRALEEVSLSGKTVTGDTLHTQRVISAQIVERGSHYLWPVKVRQFSWLRQGKVYKTGHETEYGITSLSRDQASPSKVLQVRRVHWLVKTGLHYRRDVTFHEDATRMTIGAAVSMKVILTKSLPCSRQ